MRGLLLVMLLAGSTTESGCPDVQPSHVNAKAFPAIVGVQEAEQIGVFHLSSTGFGVYTLCHNGNRIYLNEKGGVTVVVSEQSCLPVRK